MSGHFCENRYFTIDQKHDINFSFRSSKTRGSWMKSESLKIVLVEDNHDVRRIFQLILESRGYSVQSFATGQAALQAIREAAPDAAIIDIGLPDIGGFDLAQEIRNAGINSLLIALTGHDSEQYRIRSAEVGFAAHYVKPCELGKICDWIESELSSIESNQSTNVERAA